MTLRFRLLALLCVLLMACAFAQTTAEPTSEDAKPAVTAEYRPEAKEAAKPAEKTVSLGRVAQATLLTRVYSKPSTRSRVYYSVHPREYLVVKDYKKGSPWKLVLLQNMKYGFAKGDSMALLAYEYKVPASAMQNTMARIPRSTSLSSRSADGTRAAVANYALAFNGTPYVWGGNDLNNGIDCSGFIKQLYGAVGINLPRTAAQQVLVGTPVRRFQDLKAGDRLYFWDYKRNMVGHTGIFLGVARDGGYYFSHSSSTHGGVATDDLRNPKWLKLLVAARR
jgi:cell wall-associated NlpC family hydrolase